MKKSYLLLLVVLVTNVVKAQWQPAPGPYLVINNYSFDIKNIILKGDTIFASTDEIVYISLDNGNSWMYASYGLKYFFLKKIFYTNNNLFVGTRDSGMYVSNNNGSSYIAINNNLPINACIEAITKCGNNIIIGISTPYAPYLNDVFYSTDFGNNWIQTNQLSDKYVKSLYSDGNYVYAGTSYGVYKSSNNGVSWVSIGLSNHTISTITVQGSKIFAACNDSNGGVYLSTNNGSSWSTISTSIATTDFQAIAFNDSCIFLATIWNGIYKSSDTGTSWLPINNGLNCTTINAIAVNGSNVYSGCGDGFAVSSNSGFAWNHKPKTFNVHINSIVSHSSNLFTATTNGLFNRIYKTTDNGANWSNQVLTVNVLASINSKIFAGGDGSLRYSTNDGNTWDYSNFNSSGSTKIVTIVGNDTIAIAGTTNSGIFISTDNGDFWSNMNTGLNDLYINAITIKSNLILVGTNRSGVYISSNSGNSWTQSSNGIIDTCVQALINYNNILFAGTKSHGIFKSTDNGVNWFQSNTGLLNLNIKCIITVGMNIYVGTLGGGIYMSSNNGISWDEYNTGLLNLNINALGINNGYIFAGMPGASLAGGGVWKRPLSDNPLSFSEREIQSNIILNLYPNPVSKIINIETTPNINEYILIVLNTRGEELIKKQITERKIALDIRNLSNGVYFVKIVSNKGIDVKKLIIE